MEKNSQRKMNFSWKKQIFKIFKDPAYLASVIGHDRANIFIFIENYLPKLIEKFKKWRMLFYIGKNKFCPCCGKFFRKFLPTGVEYRSSAQCPGCGSLERHRLILIYLIRNTDFYIKKLKVLYVAPIKIMQNNFSKMSNINIVSIDLDSPLAMIKMDITNLQFEDNSFDVVLCSHVLEHVKNDKLALTEFLRVLKPNGWAIFQAPIDYNLKKTFEDPSISSPELRRKFFGEENHLRIYGSDFKKRLESVGFKVRIDDFLIFFHDRFIKKLGLNVNEKIYYCVK